jgi:hypothetical protein
MQKAILITSLPRSGTHYLSKNLRDCGMIAHQVNTSYISNPAANNVIAKNIFKDSFELKLKNEKSIKTSRLYEEYITSVCVVRNPEDSIISHIAQNIYNFNDSIINLDQLIENGLKTAEDWQDSFFIIKHNIDKIIPFTFDQLIKNPKSVIDFIAKQSNYNSEYIFNNLQTENLNKEDNDLKYSVNINYLKTSTSIDIYEPINKMLRGNSIFNSLNQDYNLLIREVEKRQKDLGF